jgi:hypothetical protein
MVNRRISSPLRSLLSTGKLAEFDTLVERINERQGNRPSRWLSDQVPERGSGRARAWATWPNQEALGLARRAKV